MVKPVNIVNLYIEVDTGTLYADTGLVDLEDAGFVLSSGVVIDGALVHGSLIGLDADDHSGYVLVDGSRAFSDNVGMLAPVPTTGSHLTRKDYVDSAVTSGTAGVASLNTLLGNLTLVGTEGIGITAGGTTITISGTPDEVAKALVGSDGITVVSGVNTDTIVGFRTEFVSASGSLQSQIDANATLITTTSGHLQGEIEGVASNAVQKTGDTMSGTLDMDDNALINVNYIDFDLVDGISAAEGRIVWNDTDGGLNIGMKGGVVDLQIGQETMFLAQNNSGGSISNGQPVRITGASGSKPTIELSDADDPGAMDSIGLATENIANGAEGYVTTYGLVRGSAAQPINTSSWGVGTRLFVSTTAGQLTNLPSFTGPRIILVGVVIVSDTQDGVIWVSPINALYLHELSGMTFALPSDEDLIQYISAENRWGYTDIDSLLSGHVADASAHHVRYTRNENEAIIGGANVTVVSGADTITISSAAGGGDSAALVGEDGITVISGVPSEGAVTVSGFRTEFVSASGSLQDQVDGIGAAGVTSINAVTGVVLVTGTQNVTTQTAAQTITVTGPDLDPYATDTELVTVSGHLQEQLDTTVSGINDVFALRLDEFNSSVTYVGEADPGSAEAANAWRIKKLEETGPDLSITWASGTAAPEFAWTDRLVLSYY
jgi:hypothetical protein